MKRTFAICLALALIMSSFVFSIGEEGIPQLIEGSTNMMTATALTAREFGVQFEVLTTNRHHGNWYYVQEEKAVTYYFCWNAIDTLGVFMRLHNSAGDKLYDDVSRTDKKDIPSRMFTKYEAAPGEKVLICFSSWNQTVDRFYFSVCTDDYHEVGIETTVVKEPSCTEEGIRSQVCSLCLAPCGETTPIPALGHVNAANEWVTVKTPTCDKEGLKLQYCDVCGAEMNQETIPALGHLTSSWTIKRQPTCTEEGIQVLYCDVCSKIAEQEKIPALGHIVSDEFETVVEPTAAADGLAVRRCSVCGHVFESKVLPALDKIPEEKADEIQDEAASHDWVCPSCGSVNGENFNFCFSCGTKKPEKDTCASCGFEFNDEFDFKFCPQCGAAR